MTTPLFATAGDVNADTTHTSPAKDGHDGNQNSLAVPASPASPLVIGLDLSLVATGLASLTPAYLHTVTIKVKGDGLLRLRRIASQIKDAVADAALVVVEGPSYGSQGRGQHERAGLWWLVADRLWNASVPLAVAPPSSIKKYAVGVGGGPKASKDAVLLAASRRFPTFDGDNNAADATWAAAMGLDHLTGRSPVPAAHRVALKGCTWPTLIREVAP
jgi:crossover junction endodeoxyribonuclease RuvC